MSASYEQRREIVMYALMDIAPFSAQKAGRWAEKILDALDHIPEKLDWVCEGQPRDQVGYLTRAEIRARGGLE